MELTELSMAEAAPLVRLCSAPLGHSIFLCLTRRCTTVGCGEFSVLPPQETTCSGDKVLGEECVATCASGYTAVGSGVYTCNAAGEWEGESVTCEDIDECECHRSYPRIGKDASLSR